MNQPNLSVMTHRPTPAAESPDVLAMVRRYAWLLIAGAVLGGATASGIFVYCARYRSEYTAHMPFQVLPQPAPIGGQGSFSNVAPMTTEDASQVIHRQMFLFENDRFLMDVLKSDEFHKREGDPTAKESQWLSENKLDIMKAIKRDLVISPRVNAASFEITMTARNPHEAYTLVKAASDEFTKHLRDDSNRLKNAFLDNLQVAVNNADKDIGQFKEDLRRYSLANDVDLNRSRFEIEKASLQTLNQEFSKADAEALAADRQFKTFVATRTRLHDGTPATQAADGTEKAAEKPVTDLEIADRLLTLEMKQYIENDYTLRTLLTTKMSWEQEMAGLLAGSTGTMSPSQFLGKKNEILGRIAKIDEQIEETRNKLKTDALERTQKQLEDEAGRTLALATYIGAARDKKSEEVKGYALVVQEFQGKYDQLLEKQNSVNKMHDELTLAQANRFTDDTRIQQMLNDPAEPDLPSWPKWYMFIPMGTAAGLGLSAMLAYLLVLTDTRVRTPRDISRTLQLPVLGFVPDESDDRNLSGDVETAIVNSPASMVAEAFRQIRGHITAKPHNPVSTMVVASIAPGGGATTVAANLAAAMALNDLRVLVIDANFYRPSFNRLFKELPAEGLTNVIANPQSLASAVMPHPDVARLHMMGVGTQLTGASSEVFESKSFRELLEQLKSKYDLIIFDGAPLNLVSDSLSLAARVDAVIPVVRAGEVSRGMVSRVRDQIRGVHGNLLGFILNAAQASNTGYFKENYKTFYRYSGKGSRNSSRP